MAHYSAPLSASAALAWQNAAANAKEWVAKPLSCIYHQVCISLFVHDIPAAVVRIGWYLSVRAETLWSLFLSIASGPSNSSNKFHIVQFRIRQTMVPWAGAAITRVWSDARCPLFQFTGSVIVVKESDCNILQYTSITLQTNHKYPWLKKTNTQKICVEY